MRIAYLVTTVHDVGGTAGAVVTQANALVDRHDVEILSVYRRTDGPHFTTGPGVRVRDLVIDAPGERPRAGRLSGRSVAAVRGRPSLLVPPAWDPTLDALADLGLEHHLPRLDADVLVTTTPALLAAAVQLAPPGVAIVHQEHRSSSQRTAGMTALLAFAPRADTVALLTESMAGWLRSELGDVAPEVVAVPNALPPGYRPRSLLDEQVIVAAGRLVAEKRYPRLLAAFAQVSDRLPGWRVRIFGDGPARGELRAVTRRLGLYDRVELPGTTADLASEWARASVTALTSVSEGFPLVLQEAMAAGVPVVSYDCPSGPRAIVDHGVDGLLVAPGSDAGLAAALLRVASDDDLRRSMGEAALTKAATWDVEAIARRWEDVYADAAGRHRVATGTRAERRLTSPAAPAPTVDERAAPAGVTPAEARRTSLAVLVAAADLASAGSFVVPPHGGEEALVVVPMTDRVAFLEALAAAERPAYLGLRDPEGGGWPERRGTVEALLPDLRRGRTPELWLEPWPLLDGAASLVGGCGTAVQFWETGPDGDLHPTLPSRWAERVPADAATAQLLVDGVDVRTLPLMAGPTVEDCDFPVDVVYTWVDGSDPDWDATRRRRLAVLARVDPALAERRASGPARYADRDELRHSLRSIDLFAPWVRTIHVVTDGQVPAWLDVDHPRIRLVDHREILPADALPTYNSQAIETALHRIPDLAEHLLYLNDDMFLGRPTRPERWFGPAGTTAVFASPTPVGLPRPDDAPYLLSSATNRALLQAAFGRTTTATLAHTPAPLRRSVLAEVAERYAEAVDRTAHTPFRSPTDVSMTSSLAQHHGLLTGTAAWGHTEFAFVSLGAPNLRWQLAQLARRRHDCFCLGDAHDYALPVGRVERLLADFLAAYLPIPAPWER